MNRVVRSRLRTATPRIHNEGQGYVDLIRHYLKGNTVRSRDMLQGAFGSAYVIDSEAVHEVVSMAELQAKGAEWQTVYPAYAMADLKPRVYPPSAKREIPTLRNAVARSIEVTQLSNVLVANRNGWLRAEDGRWIVDLYPVLSRRVPKTLATLKAMAPIPDRRLGGTTALLLLPGASNYYHWLHQTLPQIDAIRAAVPEAQIDRWLVRDLPAYSCDILARLGIDLSKVEVASEGSAICDRVVVGTLPSMGALDYAGEWPRRLIRDLYLPAESVVPWRRVYLKRGDGDRRPILNGDEVEQFLAERGFETRRMEGMSVAEQSQLMAETAVVVAPHGAGLANVVFCAPGTQIVELLPRLWPSPLYGMIAQACGHWHAFVPGTEPSLPALQIRRDAAGTKVSLSRLSRALKSLV